VLKPHPVMLRNLVKQYEDLLVRDSEKSSYETQQKLEDLSYTLCVSTGTQTVAAALAFAARHLETDQIHGSGAQPTPSSSLQLAT